MLSIRRWQVVSSESADRVETAIVGKRISRSKLRFDREEPAHVVEPAEVVPALLAEVGGLEQGDPGPLGKVIDGDGRSSPGSALVEAEWRRSA